MTREPSLFAPPAGAQPLAARMRPRSLDEFLGQEQLLGPGKALGELIRRGEVGSMIFSGPPGSGKTTLAFLIAAYTEREFVPFSAVTEGVPRVRGIIKEAEDRLALNGRRTILFCDEIHRFNRAQQDAFLPHVERGTIALIGATTENPSFELTGALLSRTRVFVLEPLSEAHVRILVERAIADSERGLGKLGLTIDDEALALLGREADGDARRALSALEAAAEFVSGHGGTGAQAHAEATGGDRAAVPLCIRASDIADALQRRFARYDKGGEEHYNLISALHKAMRGSDPDGALYWLARMIDGGEDPLFIARRVVRAASEDVGLADPRALSVALAAKEALHFLGQPEGELALAEAVLYVTTAPKSNRVYEAWGAALAAAREHPAEGVPLHIRNAPTSLMKEQGYGKGYQYAHAAPEGYTPQEYLPEVLRGTRFYEPTGFGFEKEIAKRMAWWAELKSRAAAAQP
ncbi:MAG: replication-associated recombination protein A [Gemmatimonadales bacterium]|nr:replication-associated recombination protein A [Gemmatimonadales bacterium]